MAQRVLLDTDKMQARTIQRALIEQLPGTQKIQPGAKTGFANDQPFASWQFGEPPTQVVLHQKHMARLVQAGFGGKVHIGKVARTRVAVFVPVDQGVAGNSHVGLGKGSGGILAACADKSAIKTAWIDRCPSSVVTLSIGRH